MSRNSNIDERKALLKRAAVDIINEKTTRLSVKSVCEKAGIKRTNFYTYYPFLKNLLDDIVRDRTYGDDIFFFTKETEEFHLHPHAFVKMLNKVKREPQFFKKMVGDLKTYYHDYGLESFFSQYFIKKCIDKGLTDENKRQYYLIFFRNGIKSITYKWMKNGFDKSAEEISEIIYDCFPTSLK